MRETCLSEIEAGARDPGVSSPGTILRRCREYQGTSIEEAAEATKIAVHHLQALEDDRNGEFASLTYLRGFLRIYAGYLGLNPDDLMRLYERLGAVDDGRDAAAGRHGGDGRRARRRFPWQKLALPALFLALMFLTSVLYNRTSTPPRPAPAPRPAVATPATPIQPVRSSAALAAAPPSSEEEPEQEQDAGGEEAAPEQTASHEGQHDSGTGFVVRLRVVQNGSLGVSIDGAQSQVYELASGDVFEWKAEKNIALELSDAGSVEAELNGKPLRAFGSHGSPASVVLGAGGIQ